MVYVRTEVYQKDFYKDFPESEYFLISSKGNSSDINIWLFPFLFGQLIENTVCILT